MNPKKVVLIGYSGHAFVICDIFASQQIAISGYCEAQEKHLNPYHLTFLGAEQEAAALAIIQANNYFTAIGNNALRYKITKQLQEITVQSPINAIHTTASISPTAQLGKGLMIGNGAVLNARCQIADGVICNTRCVIEHECLIGAYSHIAPGAILCGNVSIGEQTFVGAGSVIKQGIKIGNQVTIGAGTVVIRDIPDGTKVVGNPQRRI